VTFENEERGEEEEGEQEGEEGRCLMSGKTKTKE